VQPNFKDGAQYKETIDRLLPSKQGKSAVINAKATTALPRNTVKPIVTSIN
jgi:hypothetical protein